MKSFINLVFIVLLLASCKSGSQTSVSERKIPVEQLIFGRFCGMCPKDCATMYQINEKTRELKIDTSDLYFKTEGKSLSFSPSPLPAEDYQLAREIITQFPDSLLLARNDERFGCPDCADGCGIYLEVTTKDTRKSFYIDYQTEMLEGYIRPYAVLIRKKIEELERKK